jgi:acetate kinase
MRGIDVLVFTAGVGEHAHEIRSAACEGLQCLGLHLDQPANENCSPDSDISAGNSSGRILVIETREDVEMLAQVLKQLGR